MKTKKILQQGDGNMLAIRTIIVEKKRNVSIQYHLYMYVCI